MKYETLEGNWTDYGNDGRAMIDAPFEIMDMKSAIDSGFGWRARAIPNVHGGDYGWGPVCSTEQRAIASLNIGEAA